MPRLKLTPEFKEVISDLTHKEKDKLLFRLLAKEPLLVEQLTFKLLEHSLTMESRRSELYDYIDEDLRSYQQNYYSPGYLTLKLREISGKITWHVRATRDKYGEIQLNFLMLNLALELFHEQIDTVRTRKAQSLNQYIVKRALKLKKLLEKIHEDQHLDFWDDIQALGGYIDKIDTMRFAARELGMDLESWVAGEIF